MNDGLARQAGLLAGVLTFLLRGGVSAPPSVLAQAGTMALLTYGLLALAPTLWRRLSALPAHRPAPPSADAPGPDAPDATAHA